MKKRVFKVLFALGLIAIFLYLVKNINIFNKENLKQILLLAEKENSFGIFFTGFISILMIFFVPISWFSALGAFFFGIKGFLYVIIAGIIASIVAFYIAKIFRADVLKIVRKIYYKKDRNISLEQISRQVEKYGIGYVFFMRSMPFIPFSIANYVSGLSSIDLKDYILGTIIGLVPGQFATTYFFAKAVDIRKNPFGAFLAAGMKLTYIFLVVLWQRKSKYNTKD